MKITEMTGSEKLPKKKEHWDKCTTEIGCKCNCPSGPNNYVVNRISKAEIVLNEEKMAEILFNDFWKDKYMNKRNLEIIKKGYQGMSKSLISTAPQWMSIRMEE